MADSTTPKAKTAFYLIERYVNGRVCYWAAGAQGRSARDGWSEDSSWATRLASYSSAQQVLIHICGGEGRELLCEELPGKPEGAT